MKPRILLLVSQRTYRASAYLRAAARLGIEVTVGSEERQALEDYTPGRTVAVDYADPARSAGRLVEFARSHPLAAVLAVDDEAVETAARTAAALGLPHHPLETARAIGDKHRVRERLAAAGIPTPRFALLEAGAEPAPTPGPVPFPCVLKPLHLAASRGVIRADDPAGFRAAYHRLSALLADPEIRRRDPERSRRVLVEEYLPGTEVALEGLLCGGELRLLALFDKPDLLAGPHFEETIYVTPSGLGAGIRDRIARCAAESAAALGLTEGPFHAEFRWNRRGVWPIDLAARSIGGNCSASLRFRNDRSLEEIILRRALGMEIEPLELQPGASGVMMLPIPKAGILEEIGGLMRAQSVPHLTGIQITMNPGQEVVPLPEGNRYLGFLFAEGPTPAEVVEALREAHRRLSIDIRS